MHNRIPCLAAALALVVLEVLPAWAGVAPAAPWIEGGWTYRRTVWIQEGFFVLSNDLRDFPLLVTIDDPADPVFEHTRQDGTDLRCTDQDGVTILPHEVECFRTAGGERKLICWVRIPVVHAEGDTLFHLYYGNKSPPAKAEDSSRDVWTNGFAAVWHLSAAEAQPIGRSSTGLGDGLKLIGEVTQAPGVIGGAAVFGKEGAMDCGPLPGLATMMSHRKEAGNPELTEADPSTAWQSFTLEAWVKYMEHPLLGPRVTRNVVSRGAWSLFRHEAWRWQGCIAWNAKQRVDVFTADAEPMGVWRHLALRYDGQTGDFTIFVDGKPATGGAAHATGVKGTGNLVPENRALLIGGDYIGTLDEVRLSTTARTTEWLTVSYRNQKSPGTRIHIGKEEARP